MLNAQPLPIIVHLLSQSQKNWPRFLENARPTGQGPLGPTAGKWNDIFRSKRPTERNAGSLFSNHHGGRRNCRNRLPVCEDSEESEIVNDVIEAGDASCFMRRHLRTVPPIVTAHTFCA